MMRKLSTGKAQTVSDDGRCETENYWFKVDRGDGFIKTHTFRTAFERDVELEIFIRTEQLEEWSHAKRKEVLDKIIW